MMDFITAPLVVGFICLGIYALFELFVRRKERLLIIEKISERMDIADLGKRLSLPSYSLPRFSFSSLKTGCLLMGIGLGILVGFFCNLIVAANSHSLDFRNEYEAISSAWNFCFPPMKLFVYREERVGWSERFHSLISSRIVSFTDMMRVVRQALLPAKA